MSITKSLSSSSLKPRINTTLILTDKECGGGRAKAAYTDASTLYRPSNDSRKGVLIGQMGGLIW